MVDRQGAVVSSWQGVQVDGDLARVRLRFFLGQVMVDGVGPGPPLVQFDGWMRREGGGWKIESGYEGVLQTPA